jgi:hypothetical protein
VPEDTSKPFNDLVWTLERLFAFSRLGEREYLNLSINDCIRNVLEEAHCANDKSHQQRCQSFALERIGLSQGKDLEIMQKFKSLLKQSFVDESFSPIVKLGDGDDDKDNNPFL